ncbi:MULTISPECIES: enoyl-CoA hydratase-related protein [unclassified Pseudonocardia]|uniref:enoyl-CoA hydratase/isomerase family protein n=1 Tax=unclassified Pseudonocardia TaxID=2619320 RepID=UPI0001FFE5D8|nr:enoyl-CoA hydratase-related protein [Pseudonocardia sp. Ae707_Ps1]OLM20389.1 Enoyl-CoA hydratase [Pseudonocardia sp. Ae707_Ps1]
MPATTERVQLDISDAVATITLSNPPLNPLTGDMRESLRVVAEQLRERTDVRAVVLASDSDRAFSVGSDISTFPQDVASGHAVSEHEHAAYAALERLPQPVVAALRGHTVGGGLELALTADIRLVEDGGVLGLPEVRIGVFASGGGTQRLPGVIGAGRAALMLLTGRSIDAATALDWGLVSEIVPAGGVDDAAQALAREIAALPRRGVRSTKRCLREGLTHGRVRGEATEVEEIAEVYASADAQEGARAFVEKRAPVFTHS